MLQLFIFLNKLYLEHVVKLGRKPASDLCIVKMSVLGNGMACKWFEMKLQSVEPEISALDL